MNSSALVLNTNENFEIKTGVCVWYKAEREVINFINSAFVLFGIN